MNRFFSFTAFITLFCATAYGSARVDFNRDWHFHVDPQNAGKSQQWFDHEPDQIEVVNAPHTWNLGKHEDYIGTAWYFKSFVADRGWKNEHVELHFGATFYHARIWLNGKLVGEHEGGFSEYHVDLTPQLKNLNFLAIEINNEPKVDTIPGADLKAGPNGTIYDWWPYGGLIRDVWLTVNDGAILRWQHIDSTPEGRNASVADHIMVENLSSRPQALTLRMNVFAQDGVTPLASAQAKVPSGPGTQQIGLALKLDAVKLWSFDNPNLYRSEITLLNQAGEVLDTLTDNFGVRTIEIKDRHLYLNGARVRLTGITRHEDSPWEGLAETRGTILHDYAELKQLQVTLTRPVHYQQSPFIYDYADRNGILMIPEIPMWQFSEAQMTNPKVIALAKQILHDLIEQNYNHPSIWAWSMENESATNTPGGIAYFEALSAYSKQLDPKRYVSYADDMIAFVDPAANAARFADFVMWNEYFGSWDAPESLLLPAIDKINKGYPDKMVLVTEFGYPGVFARDERVADEERVRIIREHLGVFAKQDWIGGAILWCYQDYHSFHNLRPGQSDSYVDHGLVDKDRQRRPSFYVWQQENAPARVSVEWVYDAKGVPSGFTATVKARSETEIPSYPLENYRVQWRVLDSRGSKVAADAQVFATLSEPGAVRASWSSKEVNAYRLELDLVRPTGFTAAHRTLSWRNPQTGALTSDEVRTEPALQPQP